MYNQIPIRMAENNPLYRFNQPFCFAFSLGSSTVKSVNMQPFFFQAHPLAFGPHNGTEQTSGFIGLPNMGKQTYNSNPLKMQVKVYKPVKLLSSHSMEAAKSKILEKTTPRTTPNVQ